MHKGLVLMGIALFATGLGTGLAMAEEGGPSPRAPTSTISRPCSAAQEIT
jgi:hypothetical protein